jgi:hypothetical protein
MKIGILTFYSCDNYGAVLQAYALATYIRAKGHEVKFIQHDLKEIPVLKRKTSIGKTLKSKLINLLTKHERAKRKEAFSQFVEKHLTQELYNESFDKIIIGSDQVWNLNLTQNDLFYLGTQFKCEVSAYAASCGNYKALSEEQKKILAVNLDRLKYISIREPETAERMRQDVKKEISVVLDPTLLVTNDVFQEAETTVNVHGRYVLIYDCIDNTVFQFAQNIASQLNAKIIALSCCVRAKNFCKTFQAANMGEFLWLFSHAECIVTTSFHGCAISLSYQKSFYAMNFNELTTSRMRELLESVGLHDRYVKPTDCNITYSPIEYKEVNEKLQTLRTSSASYLLNVLEE